MEKVEVYDNGGKTVYRYTVIIGDDVYGMSSDPFSPQGFNQHAGNLSDGIIERTKIGKKLPKNKIPKEIQKAIKDRQEVW